MDSVKNCSQTVWNAVSDPCVLSQRCDYVCRTWRVVQLQCVHCWDPKSRCYMWHGSVTHRPFSFVMAKLSVLWIPINQIDRYAVSCMCKPFSVVWTSYLIFEQGSFAWMWNQTSHSKRITAVSVIIWHISEKSEEFVGLSYYSMWCVLVSIITPCWVQ
jgi:hypothetical protein